MARRRRRERHASRRRAARASLRVRRLGHQRQRRREHARRGRRRRGQGHVQVDRAPVVVVVLFVAFVRSSSRRVGGGGEGRRRADGRSVVTYGRGLGRETARESCFGSCRRAAGSCRSCGLVGWPYSSVLSLSVGGGGGRSLLVGSRALCMGGGSRAARRASRGDFLVGFGRFRRADRTGRGRQDLSGRAESCAHAVARQGETRGHRGSFGSW